MSPDELRNIGNPGRNSGIREIDGVEEDAKRFFNQQVISTTVREVQDGVFVGKDLNGITYTFRGKSSKISDYVPTIDVNGIKGLRKIKFIGE